MPPSPFQILVDASTKELEKQKERKEYVRDYNRDLRASKKRKIEEEAKEKRQFQRNTIQSWQFSEKHLFASIVDEVTRFQDCHDFEAIGKLINKKVSILYVPAIKLGDPSTLTSISSHKGAGKNPVSYSTKNR